MTELLGASVIKILLPCQSDSSHCDKSLSVMRANHIALQESRRPTNTSPAAHVAAVISARNEQGRLRMRKVSKGQTEFARYFCERRTKPSITPMSRCSTDNQCRALVFAAHVDRCIHDVHAFVKTRDDRKYWRPGRPMLSNHREALDGSRSATKPWRRRICGGANCQAEQAAGRHGPTSCWQHKTPAGYRLRN